MEWGQITPSNILDMGGGLCFNQYVTAENFKILSWAIVLPQIIYFIFAAKCL